MWLLSFSVRVFGLESWFLWNSAQFMTLKQIFLEKNWVNVPAEAQSSVKCFRNWQLAVIMSPTWLLYLQHISHFYRRSPAKIFRFFTFYPVTTIDLKVFKWAFMWETKRIVKIHIFRQITAGNWGFNFDTQK